MKRIRVVLVEDSRVQRAALQRALEADRDIEVVATADEVGRALAAVDEHRPDLVLVDLFIPGGGLNVISGVMERTPVPILVLSALVGSDDEVAVEALAAGALDALPKPQRWDESVEAALRKRVRALARVPVARRRAPQLRRVRTVHAGQTVVAMAASTGGPGALAAVLRGLGGLDAPVLLVQHLHPAFVESFVAWMRRSTALKVELATDGAPLRPGVVYVGPGERHVVLTREHRIRLTEEPVVTHVPSADVLFRSVAEAAGSRAVGVLLTGMGEDGAAGLLEIRRAGGTTIAQDEGSSAVYGMPAAAARLGAAEHVVPLESVAATIVRAAAKGASR